MSSNNIDDFNFNDIAPLPPNSQKPLPTASLTSGADLFADFLPPPSHAPVPQAPSSVAAPSSALGNQLFHTDFSISKALDIPPVPQVASFATPKQPSGLFSAGSATPSAQEITPPAFISKLSNPTKIGDGLSASLSFDVQTTAAIPELQGTFGSPSLVRRGYKDFNALRHQLVAAYPWVIIPFPTKSPTETVVDKQRGYTAEVIESRQSRLTKLLQRLACHPTLSKCPEVIKFLTVQECELPHKTVLEKGLLSTSSLVKKAGGSVFGAVGSVFGGQKEEDPLAKSIQYFQGFQLQCEKARDVSASLTKKKVEVAGNLSILGLVFEGLSKGESANVSKPMIEAFGEAYRACVSESAVMQAVSQDEEHTLGDLFREYLLYCEGFKSVAEKQEELFGKMEAVLSHRESKKKDLSTLQETGHTGQVDKLSKQVTSLFGGKKDPAQSKDADVSKLSAKVEELDQEVGKVKEDYEKYADKVKGEVALFHAMKAREYKQMLQSFVDSQIQFHSQALQNWQNAYKIIQTLQ